MTEEQAQKIIELLQQICGQLSDIESHLEVIRNNTR